MKSDEASKITFEEGDLTRGARQTEAMWSKAKGEAATADAGVKFFRTMEIMREIYIYIYYLNIKLDRQ